MQQHQSEIVIFIAAFFAAFIAFFAGVILFIQHAKKSKTNFMSEKELMKTNHQQELLSTQLEMQTQTMQHIGREIHDNVGQKLTLASLYTQQLAYENKAPHVNDKIESIGNIINESLAELRQLSKSLTDDTINDNTINELLELECDNVNNLKKCTVLFSSNKKDIILSYQTKSILVRIVQEFLQNSLKHALCKNILISANENNHLLQLHLQDDGKGFDTNAVSHKGIGLSNIKKRAEIIGGKFSLESELGKGTKLTIEIPNNK
jgi:signal transduction histidine kinase